MRFKNSVKIAFGLVLLFLMIVFIESSYRNQVVGNLHIKIANQADNYFLDSTGVKMLLINGKEEGFEKTTYRKLSIKAIETRIKANLFVQSCEIARNLRGDLFIDVQLSRPIARFIRVGKPDFYVDSLGKIMPISDKFTARTLLVTREKNQSLPDFRVRDAGLIVLIKEIYKDKFLSAQVTHLHLNPKGEVTMYLQIGDQKIEFGKCRDIEEKLKKIKIFYHEILPLKGWQAYSKVSVKYNNQIICE
jgi:cell division protein FtsQ